MSKKSKYWGKPVGAPKHPYVEYEGTPLWRTTAKALADLESNQDLELTEWHQYVVGYVCKQLASKKLITAKALAKRSTERTGG